MLFFFFFSLFFVGHYDCVDLFHYYLSLPLKAPVAPQGVIMLAQKRPGADATGLAAPWSPWSSNS